jgi:hypothetical protein
VSTISGSTIDDDGKSMLVIGARGTTQGKADARGFLVVASRFLVPERSRDAAMCDNASQAHLPFEIRRHNKNAYVFTTSFSHLLDSSREKDCAMANKHLKL